MKHGISLSEQPWYRNYGVDDDICSSAICSNMCQALSDGAAVTSEKGLSIGCQFSILLGTYYPCNTNVTKCVAYYGWPTAKAVGWCISLLILRTAFWSRTSFTGHRWTNLQLVIHLFSRDVYTRNTPPHLVQPPAVPWVAPRPCIPPVHQGLAPCYNMC